MEEILNNLIVGEYFWRVRSFSNNQPNPWSTVRSFRRINLSDFGTLGLWVDANDLNLLGNGTFVSNWPDKSGNNYNLIQPTPSFQPMLLTNSLNNNSALVFDGGDQIVNLTSNNVATHFAFFYRINLSYSLSRWKRLKL